LGPDHLPAIVHALPDWLGTALIGAVIAALAYVSKLVLEGLSKRNATRREHRANLVALQSLLLASKVVYIIQRALVVRLCQEILSAHPAIGVTYDRILAEGYKFLDERQRLEHGLIRNYTIYSLGPLNIGMSNWLSEDTHFKGATKKGKAKELSRALLRLEAHLILWRGKYEFWIPPTPENAIVYMDDEERHGLGFPAGIETLVAEHTGSEIELTPAT
jgi:hypothetical protein